MPTTNAMTPKLRPFAVLRHRVPIGFIDGESRFDADQRAHEIWDAGVKAWESYELDEGIWDACRMRQYDADLEEMEAELLTAECLRMDQYIKAQLKKYRGYE